MTEEEILNLAQRLVDAKIEIKKLQDEQNLVKLKLYDNAQGGIRCNGGRVYFVDKKEIKRFNQSKLKDSLKSIGLDDEKITEIIENSKVQTIRDANIYIQLDK